MNSKIVKNNINNNHSAQPSDWRGDFNTKYLKYEYFVGNKLFYREFDVSIGIDSCYNNLKKCQDYRLMVVYSNEDNSKSLINLNRLYIEGEEINKEELDLDGFK